MAITVKAKKGERVESLYIRFKRKCKSEKLFLQIVKNQFYIKPSQKRRQKINSRRKETIN